MAQGSECGEECPIRHCLFWSHARPLAASSSGEGTAMKVVK